MGNRARSDLCKVELNVRGDSSERRAPIFPIKFPTLTDRGLIPLKGFMGLLDIEMSDKPEMADINGLTATTNAKMRDTLVRTQMLGPDKTSGTNNVYWNAIAKEWKIPPAQARRQLCANCEYFDNTPEMLAEMESIPQDRFDADGGGRGYCHKFEFICHNMRTCKAWERKDYVEAD